MQDGLVGRGGLNRAGREHTQVPACSQHQQAKEDTVPRVMRPVKYHAQACMCRNAWTGRYACTGTSDACSPCTEVECLVGGRIVQSKKMHASVFPLIAHDYQSSTRRDHDLLSALRLSPAHDARCAWAMHACSQPLTQVPPPASRLCCPCSELALLLMLAAQQPQIERDNVTDIHAAY